MQIALKSILNDNYVKVNHQECTAVARGHHPILYVSIEAAENLAGVLNFSDLGI